MANPAARHLACYALLFSLIAAAAPALADAIDLRALNQWYGRPVAKLEIIGLPDDLVKQATGGLALTPRRKLLRLRKAVLDARVAEKDAQRLRLLMAQNGYPHATITARAEADGDNVKLTFEVTPGPVVGFGEVTFEGLPATVSVEADSANTTMSAGQRFTETTVFAASDALALAVRRAGHAEPAIDLAAVRPDSTTCDLTFTVTPGPLFTYERLVLSGVPDDLVSLTERTIGLEPGTPYSPRIVVDTRRYLRQLDLFRQIRLQSVNRDSIGDPTDDATLDLVADLKERRMITVEASVGTFTDNPVVVSASVVHRNIFKKGRGLRLALAWWQALVVRRSRTDTRVSYRIEDEDSYRLDKVALDLSTLFHPTAQTSLRLGIQVSNGVLDNRSADEDAFASDVGLATVLNGMWYRDTSDNPLDPQTGQRLTLQTDWSPPGFWTDNPFASVRAYGSRYIPLGGRRVLAARLDGAVAWPLGDALDLVADRRFFAGGASTHRGYHRRRLGPVDSANQPIGGEVRLLAGLEARLPMWSLVGLAVFVDTGQVWRYTGEMDLSEYTAAGGLGLLFGTPVGPLRLDWAYNLTSPQRDEPQYVIHFAIGHPF